MATDYIRHLSLKDFFPAATSTIPSFRTAIHPAVHSTADHGADIDIRVVRDGRGPDCNVWSNFKQYGLPMITLRADNNLPPCRSGLKEMFDAIICDHPYGVRAGGRKSGGRISF